MMAELRTCQYRGRFLVGYGGLKDRSLTIVIVMELSNAQILRYRSINDSTNFVVEPDVTCLVGKNESGKTATLQALYKSLPVDGRTPFDLTMDYPTHLTRELNNAKDSPEIGRAHV